jgi:hypothetical protein
MPSKSLPCHPVVFQSNLGHFLASRVPALHCIAYRGDQNNDRLTQTFREQVSDDKAEHPNPLIVYPTSVKVAVWHIKKSMIEVSLSPYTRPDMHRNHVLGNYLPLIGDRRSANSGIQNFLCDALSLSLSAQSLFLIVSPNDGSLGETTGNFTIGRFARLECPSLAESCAQRFWGSTRTHLARIVPTPSLVPFPLSLQPYFQAQIASR